jgi:hypothetical protein
MISKLIKDENGYFVFGPLWFVILVMVIGFIFSALKKNETGQTRSDGENMDYNPQTVQNIVKSNQCPDCGKNNLEFARFCNTCGANLEEDKKKYCPECGALNTENAIFCQECGKKFA